MHPAESDMQALQRHWTDVLNDKEIGLKNLHNALYAPLLHYAITLLQNETQAEDLLQEVFIKAWVVRHKTGHITYVKAWFYALMRRKILNQLRNDKQGLRRIAAFTAGTIDFEFSAEDIVMRREQETEQRYQVQQLLNRLPKRQREVIFLKYFNDLDYKEIAEIMRINYQSVVNLAYKAISFMKDAWKKLTNSTE